MSNSFKNQEKREESGIRNLLKSVFKNDKEEVINVADDDYSSYECSIDCERIIAIMDLGSNSLRLMIVQILSNNAPVIINQIKHMVRLGENSFDTRLLQEEQIEKTIEALKALKQTCEQYNVSEILAIATAAVRKAENADEFVKRVYDETEIQFNVISGDEEARLIYLGVSTSLAHSFDLRLYIDIGGGSTELVVGHSDSPVFMQSVPIGCVLVTNKFMQTHKEVVSQKLFSQMQDFAKESASKAIKAIKKYDVKEVYASSGTAKTLFELSHRLQFNKLPNDEKAMSVDTLKQVIKYICGLNLAQREELEGLSNQRAQVIVAGAAILLSLAKELNIKKINITPLGLQHGVLVDYIQKTSKITAPQQEKTRRQSVLGLAHAFHYEKKHAEQVNQLALMLHDSAVDSGLIPYRQEWRNFLDYASLLHDIGIAISYVKHYKHSYYIIKNSELLGFTNEEKESIGLLTFFHNKRPSKKYNEYMSLEADKRELIAVYALFLAIAENLDKLHRANIYETAFIVEDDILQLYAQQNEVSIIEEHAVRLLAKSIEKVFQKKINIYFST